MIETTNLTNTVYDLERYRDADDVRTFLRAFSLDGLEVMPWGENTLSFLPPDAVPGLHLGYFPCWVDFYRGREEAVKMDGGGHMTAFFRVMLPIALPGIGTLAIFCLQGTWEEFFSAKVVLGGAQDQITLPVMIQSLKGAHSTRWEWIFAASILAQLPMLLLFAVFQKHFVVSGLSEGSVKG